MAFIHNVCMAFIHNLPQEKMEFDNRDERKSDGYLVFYFILISSMKDF